MTSPHQTYVAALRRDMLCMLIYYLLDFVLSFTFFLYYVLF